MFPGRSFDPTKLEDGEEETGQKSEKREESEEHKSTSIGMIFILFSIANLHILRAWVLHKKGGANRPSWPKRKTPVLSQTILNLLPCQVTDISDPFPEERDITVGQELLKKIIIGCAVQ
ncbi:hypothetical protein [Melghirimyces profundicolus]|uniref:hypothetical protein n=1 Tax=Melghirimyces profundicolus TaxID=1242148 RepID=UPI0011B21142|nr:hypothetical protein [Melghirimyces profundicolus]